MVRSTVIFSKRTQNSHIRIIRAFFCSFARHLHGSQKPEEKTARKFKLFKNRVDGFGLNQFRGVHMNEIPVVKDLLTTNILLYDFDVVVGNNIRELARQNVHKNENTVRLLRHINHICYVSNVNAIPQSFSYPNYDTFFNRSFNLEGKFSTCSERV